MARDPHYPEDAPVGEPAEAPVESEAAQAAAAAKATNPRRARHLVTGAAIGIGSAALVAALLYARSSRRGDRSDD